MNTPEKLDLLTAGSDEPINQAQMEAQVRVFIARLLRNQLHPGKPIDAAKREITIQVRRARKLAQDEAARWIASCLDYETVSFGGTISPDLLQALERVRVLARMLRGPDE